VRASALATLYAHLQSVDLRLGVTERLRIESILEQTGELDRQQLAHILAAILVKRASDQRLLDQALEAWWSTTIRRQPSSEPQAQRERGVTRPRRLKLRWSLWIWLALPLFLLISPPEALWPTPSPPKALPETQVEQDTPVKDFAETYRAHQFKIGPAPSTPPPLYWDFGLMLLSLALLLYLFYLSRRPTPIDEPGSLPNPDEPLPRPIPLLPDASPKPRFVVGAEQDALVWGIGRFVSEEETTQLDPEVSIQATLRVGYPSPRYQRARHYREVWLWVDDSARRIYPEISLVQEEIIEALRRAGLPIKLAYFGGVPDSLRGEEGPRFTLPEVEEQRGAVRVALLTDGKILDLRAKHPNIGPATRRILRDLSLWPELTFVDFSRGRHGLAHLLAPFELHSIEPEQLALWLGEQALVAPEEEADLHIWAAACALSHEPLLPETALQLRDHLPGLEAQPWGLSRLPKVQSAPGGRFAWSHRDEAKLINWLYLLESGERSLFENTRQFWRGQLAKTALKADHSVDRHHREDGIALLDLWEMPARALEEAAERLFERRAHLGESIRDRLERLLPQDYRRLLLQDYRGESKDKGVLLLPWSWGDLGAQSREQLRMAGLGRAFLQLPSLDLRRASRLWMIGAMAAGLLLSALLALFTAQEIPPLDEPQFELSDKKLIQEARQLDESWTVEIGTPRRLEVHRLEAGRLITEVNSIQADCQEQRGKVTLWRCGYSNQVLRPHLDERWPRRSLAIVQGLGPQVERFVAKLWDSGSVDMVAQGDIEPAELFKALGPLLPQDQLLAFTAQEPSVEGPALGWIPGREWGLLMLSIGSGELKPLAEVWTGAQVIRGPLWALGEERCPETRSFSDGRYVRVCGGRFQMGSEDKEAFDDEKPAHRVNLDGFWIGETEVSNAQYRKFKPGHRPDEEPQWPVSRVTWDEAKSYCTSIGGRLPTEAEWEYAARGPEGRKYPWGEEKPSKEYAIFGDSKPRPVGSYPKGRGPFGTLDQAGNVWEWVFDCYGPYEAVEVDNPRVDNDNCQRRSLRGGSFDFEAWHLRSSFRLRNWPWFQNRNLGFRCVRVRGHE